MSSKPTTSSAGSSGTGSAGGWANKPSSILQATAADVGTPPAVGTRWATVSATPRRTNSADVGRAPRRTHNNNNNNNNNNNKPQGEGHTSRWNNNNNNNNTKTGRGGGRGTAGGHHSHRTGGNVSHTPHHHHQHNKERKAPAKTSSKTPMVNLKDVTLFTETGTGNTAQEKVVVRLSMEHFLATRLNYLDPPTVSADGESSHWTPHARCIWTSQDRGNQIQEEMKALWDYKPLEVNDDTRWKARVMEGQNETATSDSPEEILRKATAILNKLSWTTLDKLTVRFVETLSGGAKSTHGDADPSLSKETVRGTMQMIVDKAMAEPHFAELYARFSGKLAAVHKTFKKMLLSICQEQFEISDKEPEFPASMDPAEKAYELLQSRKQSIGLMAFIGELYKLKLIKGAIMIGCLQRLMVIDDEEKLECFTNLMATIGARLHEHENEPEVHEIWEKLYSMAGKTNKTTGPKAPSTRIKFLLQDLIELKENNWVKRREEEKAKTIAQIHKEAAEAERSASRNGPVINTNSSSHKKVARSHSASLPNTRSSSSLQGQESFPDGEGFMQVPNKPKKNSLRRAQSDSIPDATSGMSSLQLAMSGKNSKTSARKSSGGSSQRPASQAPKIAEYLDPKQVGEKTKTLLKEYFVSGDTADAVLSFDDLIGKSHNGDVIRGGAVVEAGILLVMEMKEEDVKKFLMVTAALLKQGKIPLASFAKGMNNPLESLRDIEIDAPMAAKHLARIIASWLSCNALSIDFLLGAPEYFLSDGRPAALAKQVLQIRGGNVSDEEVKVVTQLMSEEEKKNIASVKEWLQ
jgi:hypothetical protein